MIQVTLGGVKAQEKTEKPFPKYMISTQTGRIVYFEKPRVGVQVNEVRAIDTWPSEMPNFRDAWPMDHFVDYDLPTSVAQPSNKEIPFPKVMISIDKEIIILATEANMNSITGTCIYSLSGDISVGQFLTKWRADIFSDLPEPITLTFENK